MPYLLREHFALFFGQAILGKVGKRLVDFDVVHCPLAPLVQLFQITAQGRFLKSEVTKFRLAGKPIRHKEPKRPETKNEGNRKRNRRDVEITFHAWYSLGIPDTRPNPESAQKN